MIGAIFLGLLGYGLATVCAAGALVAFISWNIAPMGSAEERQMLRATLSMAVVALLLGGGTRLVLGL